MVALAVALSLAVGLLGSRLEHPPARGGALGGAALRGYPTAIGLCIVLLWMLVVAPVSRLIAAIRRRESAHVAIAVKPGRYEDLDDIARRIDAAALDHEQWEIPYRLLLQVRLRRMPLGSDAVDRRAPRRVHEQF